MVLHAACGLTPALEPDPPGVTNHSGLLGTEAFLGCGTSSAKIMTSQEQLAILPSAREVWVGAQRKKLCKNDGLFNSTPDALGLSSLVMEPQVRLLFLLASQGWK